MKHVVITGASSGIGEELTQKFSSSDWRVTMVARRQDKLEALQKKLSHCEFEVCDLSQPQAILKLIKALEGSPIDALINNAGGYRPQAFENGSDDVWDFHYQVNLMSAIRLTRGLWENLKQQKGAILNISSTLAIRPIANTSAYSALKAAMNNWTLSLAIEGAPFGVRANAICPGIIDTPIHSYVGSEKPEDKKIYDQVQKLQPLGRTGRPTDISGMALQLCSQESSWTTGNLISIDGGILLNS